MKQAGLFIPLVVFFGIFLTTGDIFLATGGIMAVVSIQVIFEKFNKGKVEQKLLITWVLLMLFGSATLLFRNPIFIQWKLTIVNWIFAFTLIITHLLGKKPIKDYQMINPDEIAKNYLDFYNQDKSAWSWEIELRTSVEKF